MFIETYLVLFCFFLVLFIIGQVIKDNSIVDIGWGSGFVLSAIFSYFRYPNTGLKATIITIFIVIWGLRLSYHIAKRNIGKPEDYRYVQMRKSWGNKNVMLKAFLKVYLLQFLIQSIVTLPVIYGNTTSNQKLQLINIFGIVLWGIGFFFEAYGDYQLKQFKADKNNKGKLMDKGLWALTRHPNYFGDSTMWFGIFFIAISNINGLWIIIGPCFMTFFIVFVSGVAMLEKKYKGRPDFEVYKRKTSVFFPWFPKK